jgi:hypothetical protein
VLDGNEEGIHDLVVADGAAVAILCDSHCACFTSRFLPPCLQLVGHIERADGKHMFVSMVTDTADLAADAAIDLRASALRQENVL